MSFARGWLTGLVICMVLWLVLGPQHVQGQIIGKEKKKLLFWQRGGEPVVLNPSDTAVLLDSLDIPKLAEKKDSLAEEEKKGKKKKKKTYFGYRVKKGFTRTGTGSGEIITTFYYLKEYKEPNAYVPEKYYFDVKQRKVFKARVLDPQKTQMYILHGPFTRKQNDVLIEEGYFYVGAKHLRWETYRSRDSVLTKKEHYEKGFLRDAVISYYDDAHTKIKEVIPYQFGQVQGMYYKFYENGQPEWQGLYDKGRKVGVWINFFDFRGRRRYEFQYPASAFEPDKEPVMVRQYDRHGAMVFEKK